MFLLLWSRFTEIANKTMRISLFVLQIFILRQCVHANTPHPDELKKDEYNFWWAPISFKECAEKCIYEKAIFCKSFSYCEEGEACSTYEHDRQTAPPEFYNRPGVLSVVSGDPYQDFEWDYYERKSEKYRKMEKQVNWLKNLTAISVEEASEVLTDITGFVKPASDADEEESESNATALPSELEIAGKSLMLIMDLNPIANASLKVAKEFADVVVNVSSALADSSHATAWKIAQRDPSSPGSSSIVTSAEQLTRRMSKKLFEAHSSTSGILSEAKGIAVWLDVASSTSPLNDIASYLQSLDNQNKPAGNNSGKNLDERFLSDKETYVFPNNHIQSPTLGNSPNKSEVAQDGEDGEETDYFQDIIILPRAALGDKAVVTNVRYKNLKEAMPTRFTGDSKYTSNSFLKSTNVLNSAVLTTSIFPRPLNMIFENEPVTILFKHVHAPKMENLDQAAATNKTSSNATSTIETLPSPTHQEEPHNEENMFCVYWEEGTDEDDGGVWSKEGCSLVDFNQTHTVCNCTHLTSFAVLLQIVDYNTDDEHTRLHLQVLGIISKVGCILSLLGVTVMCAAFVKLKMHTDNMKIHFNLGLAVGFADLTFLFEELAEGSKSGCVIVTILLYYFNMTVLAWMFVEGFHLYSQVVVVFVSIRRRVKYYVVAGWGIPALILAISMGILNSQIGMHETCWLSPADSSIWAFAAPALVVIVVNMIVLIAVVRVIIRIQPGKSGHLKVSKLRNAVKGSIFLFPLLGTTWLFGLLSLSKETLLFQYLFAITNSLQGFFLFIFHCMCNSEVREDARRHKWFRSTESSISSSSPPFLSNAFNLNVASGLKRFRNSISFDVPSFPSGGTDEQSEDENKPKKTHSLFSKMFALRLPTTIAEKEDKYEAHSEEGSSTPEPVQFNEGAQESEEDILPLPGMPTKHDTYENLQRLNTTLAEDAQNQLDQLLVDQIIQNALKDMFKDCKSEEKGKEEKTSIEPLVSDKDEKEKKMQMSYDSGLNSIENESMLDEEDEIWMQSKNGEEIKDSEKNPESQMEDTVTPVN